MAHDETSCRVEIEANDVRWAAFGLAMLEAPVTIESAPTALVATLRAWSDRLTAAAESVPA